MRLGNLLDDLCDVHNHFLKLENRYYRRSGKYAGRFRLQPHLTKLLQRTKQHWAWIPRDTLDAVIIRLHIAWERFFNVSGIGKPRYKRKGRYRSAKFQSGYLLEEGRVRLSFKSWDTSSRRLKFDKRWFSFHHHRNWGGDVRYLQILRDSVGMFYLYVVTDDVRKAVLPATGESVGADFGLKAAFLTLNTGEKIQSPQLRFQVDSLSKMLYTYRHANSSQRGTHLYNTKWTRFVSAMVHAD